MLINPYTPGAGSPPNFLAGRDKIIKNAQNNLFTTANGGNSRHVIYYGLRGVGKTVLLNVIEQIAETNGLLYKHIEVKEDDNFVKMFSIILKQLVRQMSIRENVKDVARKAIGLLKSFNLKWNYAESEISAGLDPTVDAIIGEADSGDLQTDITELLVSIGNLAISNGACVCLFFDEIQYLNEEELISLFCAIHRTNQLRLPVIMFGAGLPKVLRNSGEAKSYTERLFDFVEIGSLHEEDATAAICEPLFNANIIYNKEAIAEVIRITEGYPYFIQEMGSMIWNYLEEKNMLLDGLTISVEHVLDAENLFNERLDKSFFKVRLDRMTPSERTFAFAMIECSNLPCEISEVASEMKKSV